MSNQVLYKDYFSPDEAADYCCVSPRYFEAHVRTRVPAIRLSARVTLFRRADLDDYESFPRKPMRSTAQSKLRQLAVRERTPAWADSAAIAAVYAEARRLTVETGVKHHVDHVLPLRGKSVSGLHVHTNLRVVPAKVNTQKGNRWTD